jgi:probable HAF family extracellular repeat protein
MMFTSMRRLSAGIAFTVLASGAIADGATTPIFRNLDPPANEYILGPKDINNRGFIVGEVYDRDARYTGFFMIDRIFVRIDPAPEVAYAFNTAAGIEDKGVIVGFGGDPTSGPTGFMYADGVFTTIPPAPDGSVFYSEKINTRGYIVGRYIDGVSHGLLFFKGTFTRFDVPNSASNPGISTIPHDINERGDIVGVWGDISGVSNENHGFIRSVAGRYTTFDVPGSTFTVPTGINNLGHVVGYYADQSGITHGFLLIGGRFARIDIPGSTATDVAGINDSDEIVGRYYAPNVVNGHAFIANALSFRR